MKPIAWEEARKQLVAVADPFERRLQFAAMLCEAVGGDYPPVIVGGHAVEFYSLGNYATNDLDLVVQDKKPVEARLREWGFEQRGRIWWRADLGIAVDLIAVDIDRAEGQVRQVGVGGRTAHMLRIEEVIVDRLNACVHWNIPEQCEWAREMVDMNQDEIDWAYLERRAAEERVSEAAEELRRA